MVSIILRMKFKVSVPLIQKFSKQKKIILRIMLWNLLDSVESGCNRQMVRHIISAIFKTNIII